MSDWDSQPLGDLATNISTGSTPSTAHQEFFGGAVQWFTPGDIGDSKKLVASSRTITPEALANGKVRLFEKASLLVTCIGEIGRVGILQQPSSSNQQITAIKFGDDIDENFAYYWFVANQNQLARRANLALVPILNNERLKEILFSYPSLPEQRRIAALLDKADHLRRTRRYAAQLSDTFLQAVFVRMFGKYITADTDTRFQDVLEMPLQNGFFETNDKYGNGTPVVWVDNLYHTISIDTTNLRRVQTDEAAINKYEVSEGDLLFTRSSLVREGVGQVNIVPELEEKILFESHIIRARVNKKKVNPFFILELYRSDFGRAFIMRGAHTSTMTTVQQDTIDILPCPLPPLALQQKFARVVQQFERLRAQQQEAERQAEHLFQTLLHRAFSGQV